MLQAILKGKIRGLFDKVQDGKPWRKAYSSYEDFLTASVVGRMTYLPGDILWKIIRSSALHCHLGKYAGCLENVEFWPNWPLPERMRKTGIRREPDVFLEFEEYDVIVEAKRDDSLAQNENQWCDELFCYLNRPNSEERRDKPILLWVLGGMGTLTTEKTLDEKRGIVCDRVTSVYPDAKINFAISPWKNILYCMLDLRDYLIEDRKKGSIYFEHDRDYVLRVVNDIIEALQLHGIREWHFLSETLAYCEDFVLQNSSLQEFKLLGKITFEETSKDQFGWKSLEQFACGFVDGLKWYGGKV